MQQFLSHMAQLQWLAAIAATRSAQIFGPSAAYMFSTTIGVWLANQRTGDVYGDELHEQLEMSKKGKPSKENSTENPSLNETPPFEAPVPKPVPPR